MKPKIQFPAVESSKGVAAKQETGRLLTKTAQDRRVEADSNSPAKPATLGTNRPMEVHQK